MKLVQQVVSLELAHKMKELNVPQQSIFMWKDGEVLFWGCGEPKDFVSAFTIAELGEMLPDWTRSYFTGERWDCESGGIVPHFTADTEVDARAKLLVYLLENKLITL